MLLFISPWQKDHSNSNYFMSLIPNETRLENSFVLGNYRDVMFAQGIRLCLEPHAPAFLHFAWNSQVKFKKIFWHCFWLELWSNEAGKKEVDEEVSLTLRKEAP